MGVASAALITGYFIDNGGWRAAFVVPGVFSILMGAIYWWLRRENISYEIATDTKAKAAQGQTLDPDYKRILIRVSAIVFLTTAVASITFQSTTFALPKMLDEQLAGLSQRIADIVSDGNVATVVGSLAFLVHGNGVIFKVSGKPVL